MQQHVSPCAPPPTHPPTHPPTTPADPLRTVLWGDYALSVLLPAGSEPIKALHSFRDNKTTLLLATPQAARGLDLPAVSHVYNVVPPGDAVEYLHRAGRAGRIGSPVKGEWGGKVCVRENVGGWVGWGGAYVDGAGFCFGT
jgi:hypothetical protein